MQEKKKMELTDEQLSNVSGGIASDQYQALTEKMEQIMANNGGGAFGKSPEQTEFEMKQYNAMLENASEIGKSLSDSLKSIAQKK